ncbi:hypothetical protein AFLA70_559g000431 [Aspergillus flavus AF70]|nr:hypothetical protein AFLA70_559g000431 [Aspergillus flavus AF70]
MYLAAGALTISCWLCAQIQTHAVTKCGHHVYGAWLNRGPGLDINTVLWTGSLQDIAPAVGATIKVVRLRRRIVNKSRPVAPDSRLYPASYNPVCCSGADALRVIYELSVRSLRAHREQEKHIHEHRSLQEALQQTTSDLEETVNLADLLYETNQRMGTAIDFLLKERGIVASGESDSFEIMLNRVLNQLEGIEGDRRDRRDRTSPTPAGDITMAENPVSTGDARSR